MQQMLTGQLTGIVYIIIAFAYIYLAKWISDKRAQSLGMDVPRLLHQQNNLAFSMRRGGLYLALSLGLLGAISGPSLGLWADTKLLVIDGALILIFVFTAQWINDRIILSHIDNIAQLRQNNQAVGFSEFGAYIATGLIAMASFSGEGGGIISSLVFFVLGQIVLILATQFYEWYTPWRIYDEIAHANTAVGLQLGSVMIALGIVLAGALEGNFVSWQNDLFSFALNALLAIVLLILASWLIDPLFIRRQKQERNQPLQLASSIILGSIKIVAALMINAAVV